MTNNNKLGLVQLYEISIATVGPRFFRLFTTLDAILHVPFPIRPRDKTDGPHDYSSDS
jgi:hypothetical protein